MHTAQVFDISSREKTPDGFMRVRGAITRVGVMDYDASEIGVGIRGQRVRVMHTKESTFAQETIDSALGKPVTLNHPVTDRRQVTPGTYRWHSVGSVMEAPEKSEDGRLMARLSINDQAAIDALDRGTRQISIGKTFNLQPAPPGVGYEYLTLGPILVNHIALVDGGRAGTGVEVFDNKEPEMTPQEISKAVSDGIEAGVNRINGNGKGASVADGAELKSVLTEVLKPVTDMVSQQKTDAEEAAFKAQQKELSDKLVADTRAEERVRFSVIEKAKKVVPADKLQAFQAVVDNPQSKVKDILVAAVADHVPNATAFDTPYLQGRLDQLAEQAGANPPAAGPGSIAQTYGNPPGAAPAAQPGASGPGASTGPKTVQDEATDAQSEYMKHVCSARFPRQREGAAA